VYFYGIDGSKLTTLTCDSYLNCSSAAYNVYFGGKLVQSKGNTVVTDRLGSVRWSSLNGVTGYVYFPYGEERTITADDREKFGTYTRDGSGQDYADQRYYGVGTGRFWSPDPAGRKAASLRNPTSWNRYLYVNGDPINNQDPSGRSCETIGGSWFQNSDTSWSLIGAVYQDNGDGSGCSLAGQSADGIDTGIKFSNTCGATEIVDGTGCDPQLTDDANTIFGSVAGSAGPVVDGALVATGVAVAGPTAAGEAVTAAAAPTVATALEQTVAVIGRLDDTLPLLGNATYNVFFTQLEGVDMVAADQAWVQGIISAGQSVALQSVLTSANVFNGGPYNEGFTMYGVELGWFINAGYTLVGGYLVPPVH